MLVAAGSNGCGQLGLGDEDDRDGYVEVRLKLPQPVRICGGGNSTLICGEKAFLAGKLGDFESNVFTEIAHPHNRKWLLGSAGWDQVFLVDDHHSVYTMGRGKRGELGLGDTVQAENLALVTTFEAVKSIKSAMSHTLVLLENGQVWGWGYNRLGQLNQREKSVSQPTLLSDRATDVACGRDYSLIVQDGKCMVWGKLRNGELFDGKPCTHVYSGWSFAAIELGNHYTWTGNNSHAQLAAPVAIDKLALGSEHSLALVGEKIVSWGWGEHGNCPAPYKVTPNAEIFAGCATSFIYIP